MNSRWPGPTILLPCLFSFFEKSLCGLRFSLERFRAKGLTRSRRDIPALLLFVPLPFVPLAFVPLAYTLCLRDILSVSLPRYPPARHPPRFPSAPRFHQHCDTPTRLYACAATVPPASHPPPARRQSPALPRATAQGGRRQHRGQAAALPQVAALEQAACSNTGAGQRGGIPALPHSIRGGYDDSIGRRLRGSTPSVLHSPAQSLTPAAPSIIEAFARRHHAGKWRSPTAGFRIVDMQPCATTATTGGMYA